MTDPKSSLDPVLAVNICHEFEAAWSAEKKTDFRSFLKKIPRQHRFECFRMLLEIEYDRRKQIGEQIDPENYRQFGKQAFRVAKEIASGRLNLNESLTQARTTKKAASFELPSDQIGPYKLVEKIGQGGMGSVWIAEQDEPVRRRVALKLIRADIGSEQVVARFEAERQALAMMDHPSIAKVLDAGATDDGTPYFAMELIEGTPLTQFCDDYKLDINRRLKIFVTICKAIQHAHQKGIVHRDLKPSNILVTIYDNQAIPKVIDFGLAKALDHTTKLTDKTLSTEFGNVVGTLQYMSPEQASTNSADLDFRTDIYSLGVMLYELLTGSTPIEKETFAGNALLSALSMIRDKELPRPSQRLDFSTETADSISQVRNISFSKLQQILRGELDWVVMKALEKDKNRRYKTATDFGQDIQQFLNGEPVKARPPSAVYKLRKYVQKNKVFVGSALTITILVMIGTGVFGFFYYRSFLASDDKVDQHRFTEHKSAMPAEINKIPSENSKEADDNLARAVEAEQNLETKDVQLRYSMAMNRWNSNQTEEARDLLYQVPEKYKNFEWHYLNQKFSGGITTCYGHASSVNSVVYSPNGKLVASAGNDSTVRIWNATTGETIRKFDGHIGLINDLAFDSDGQSIASAGMDKSLMIWDVNTANVLKIPTSHSQRITCIEFSPNGKLIASGSRDGQTKIWNVATGEELWSFSGHVETIHAIRFNSDGSQIASNSVTSLKFTPDGKKIASASFTGSIFVWDLGTGKVTTQTGGKHRINSICFSPDGDRIFSVGERDNSIRVWDARKDGTEISSWEAHSDGILSIAISPGGDRIATGCKDSTIKIWDWYSQKGTIFKGHCDRVTSIAFSPDGDRIVSASLDKTIKLWNACDNSPSTTIRTDAPLDMTSIFDSDQDVMEEASKLGQLWNKLSSTLVSEYTGRVSDLVFSRDRSRIASKGGTIDIWDTASSKIMTSIEYFVGINENRMAYSPDGRLIATGGMGNKRNITLWSAVDGTRLQVFPGHSAPISSIVFSPDGSKIASGCTKGIVKVWDVKTRKMAWSINAHDESVNSIAYHPDGRRIATGSSDKFIRVWDATNGKRAMEKKAHNRVICLLFDPTGKKIIYGSLGAVLACDALSGEPIGRLSEHNNWVFSIAISKDGNLIGSAGMDNSLRCWDAKLRRELYSVETQNRHLTSVSFSPDGKWLATGDAGGQVVFWKSRTGEKDRILPEKVLNFRNLMFSQSGNQIAILGKSAIRIWDLKHNSKFLELDPQYLSRKSLVFSRDSKLIAGVTSRQHIKVWNAVTGKEVLSVKEDLPHQPSGDRLEIFFNPEGTRLIAKWHEMLKVWDLETGEVLFNKNKIGRVVFGRDRNHIVYVEGRLIKTWDCSTSQRINSIITTSEPVITLALNQDGTKIVALEYGKTGSLGIWDYKSGEKNQTISDFPRFGVLAFNREGNILAAIDGTSISFWNVVDGSLISKTRKAPSQIRTPGPLEFNDNGTRLVASLHDNSLRIWDVNSGLEVAKLEGNSSAVWRIKWSANGNRLTALESEKKENKNCIRVWHAPDVNEVALRSPNTKISSYSFSLDGLLLVAGTSRGFVRVWDLRTQAEIHAFETFHGGSISKVAFSDDNSRVYAESGNAKYLLDIKEKQVVKLQKESVENSTSLHQHDRWSLSSEGNSLLLIDKTYKQNEEVREFLNSKSAFDTVFHIDSAKRAGGNGDFFAAVFHNALLVKSNPTRIDFHDQLQSSFTQLQAEFNKKSRNLTPYLPQIVKEALQILRGNKSSE